MGKLNLKIQKLCYLKDSIKKIKGKPLDWVIITCNTCIRQRTCTVNIKTSTFLKKVILSERRKGLQYIYFRAWSTQTVEINTSSKKVTGNSNVLLYLHHTVCFSRYFQTDKNVGLCLGDNIQVNCATQLYFSFKIYFLKFASQ